MRERSSRLRAIKIIIKEQRIESQEDLLGQLLREGFNVTQATLSRDLKFLKVGKISDGFEGYYYTLPGIDRHVESEKTYIHDFQRAYVSIDFSNNIAIIKTLPGHADSAALALDKIAMSDILGTIAGDDTIFVVIKEGIKKETMYARFKEKFPTMEI